MDCDWMTGVKRSLPLCAMNLEALRSFLDHKAEMYQNPRFISDDPIQVPHRFSKRQDVEIAAFFSATLAWGNRKAIVKNASRMMTLLDETPYDFIKNHTAKDLERLPSFTHRTFHSADLRFFIRRLRVLYDRSDTLETYFRPQGTESGLKCGISWFRNCFLGDQPGHHAAKHISDPWKNSAAKRLNLFLRWMVRSASRGVDFGLWKGIQPRYLCMPLDVHSGRVARRLGLLKRPQDDWKAVEELTQRLRKWDASDPVKYDFALFGLGAFEGF